VKIIFNDMFWLSIFLATCYFETVILW